MKHEPDFGEYFAWLDAQGDAKELQAGRYYRLDSGTKAFKLLSISTAFNDFQEADVAYYPSGARRKVPVARIVEPHAPWPKHYCPGCGSDFAPHDRSCRDCGWSVTNIALPKNYNPATAKAAQNQGDHPMSQNTLFRLTEGETTTYVRRVGTDGSLAVVKDANTGGLRAVDPKLLEEVLPFSVGIRFGGNSTTYHYHADKGQFSVGDLLLADSNGHANVYAHVVSVDTKSRRATKRFSGWKLAATLLNAEPVDNSALFDEGDKYGDPLDD